MTILLNTFKLLFKKKINMIFMFAVPIVASVLVMSGSNTQTVRVGYLDGDNTKFSQKVISELSKRFSVSVIGKEDIKRKLVMMNVDYIIEIPEGFTKSIIGGNGSTIKGYSISDTNMSMPVDVTLNSHLNSAGNLAKGVNGDETKFYEALKYYDEGSVSVSYSYSNDSERKAAKTGWSLNFLVMSMLYLSSYVPGIITQSKRDKTFYRIFSAPVSSKSYMIQNITCFFAMTVIQTIVILGLLKYSFQAYLGPSAVSLFIVMIVYGLVTVSYGTAISSIAKNSRTANVIASILNVPICMLGGCFWPREFMPDVMQKVGNFVPTTWVIKAYNSVLRGSSVLQVSNELLILLLFALVLFLLGSWRKADIAA